MNANDLLQAALFIVVLVAAAVPVARYLTRVMDGSSAVVRVFGPLERVLYRIAGVDPQAEMGWKQYAVATIAFNALGVLFLYALLRVQGLLPANPQGFGPMTVDGAFNTAVSFVTNTNWQDYTPEQTVSYLTQMLGLTVQNFLSAATGIVVVIALIRGFARHTAQTIGNFWVDVTRVTFYVLVPMAAIIAALLMSQGVIQNLKAYQDVPTLQTTAYAAPKLDAQGNPVKDAKGSPVTVQTSVKSQTLAMGPVASQEAIKMLGTNGGGFFNGNSAHPYENPTPFSNFLQIFSILIIPAALCLVFGSVIGDRRQGVAVLAAMTVALAIAIGVETSAEQGGTPVLAALNVDQAPSELQAGGNMEGKETRFGIAQTGIFVVATTAASCGAVDAMHDSLTPVGGLVPMLLMQLGEVIFGGVGSGLYGMLVFALLAVFVAGLMIGRTPEYVGKKIESYEMKMVSIVVLLTPLLVLVGTSIAVLADAGRAGIANPGPHGFSEILYAFSSAANNNGSAFGGLSVNTPFYNWMTAIAMWFGRFGTIVPVLAIAGSLAAKKRIAATSGTLPTHGPLFVVLLLGTVLLVGALTYVPALALGPGVEHLMLFVGAH